MALGVVIHAAMVFNTSHHWIVSDPSGGPAFGVVVNLIHLYRMPVFFLVSGFFTGLLYLKYPASEFLRSRVIRILVPFVTTLISANALLIWYLQSAGIRPFTIANWVSHLWFLAFLMFYILAFFTLQRFGDALRIPAALLARICRARLRWPGLLAVFLAATFGTHLFIKVFNLWDVLLLGFSDLEDLLNYAVYFVAGLLIFRCEPLYRMITGGRFHSAFAALILAVAVVAQTHFSWPFLLPDIWREMLRSAATFFGAVFLLSWFRRHADIDSPRSRLFSDASYTIYLLHGPFLIGFAMLLLPMAIPGLIKFFVLIVAVIASTLALHLWVIARSPLLALLFNGKVVRPILANPPEHRK